ncbi:hypothetical protein CAPTEDRAFT_51764, partial [Capitella teleta]
EETGRIVKLLLKNGANVNKRNFIGMTPFVMAVRTGNVSMVKLFLEYGAEVNAQDIEGSTVLHYVV